MAVRLLTTDANGVMRRVKQGINAGHIDTWSYDEDGDFTHTTGDGRWENRSTSRSRGSGEGQGIRVLWADCSQPPMRKGLEE